MVILQAPTGFISRRGGGKEGKEERERGMEEGGERGKEGILKEEITGTYLYTYMYM